MALAFRVKVSGFRSSGVQEFRGSEGFGDLKVGLGDHGWFGFLALGHKMLNMEVMGYPLYASRLEG